MNNLALIPKRVFWRRGPYKSGHYRPANGKPLKCLFRRRADGGPIGLLCAGWKCDIPIFKNGVSRAMEYRTEQKFYLDFSITSSSSQQYIIYKTYILRMHLKCY